ncbi:MAG: Mo-dependent nitrogenase [Leptolyngbya sp.]|nr:MAG: Mo-dependent nitrogenase [Leptolyngbya sp.]
MERSHYETESPQADRFIWIASEIPVKSQAPVQPSLKVSFAPLKPIRQWLDGIEICDRDTAHVLCSVIPAQCPFERTIKFAGRTILHIPPLCKLNPFYDQVVGLRFRSLCYLADECGEDISPYC